MNTLEILTVSLVTVWLACLTLLQLTSIRQIGILTAKMSLDGNSNAAHDFLNMDGPEIGSEVPISVDEILATIASHQSSEWALFVSSTCATCRQLMADIHQNNSHAPFHLFIAGTDPALVDALRQLAPDATNVVGEPHASAFAKALHIRSTPFMVKIVDGIVTDKTFVFDYKSMHDKMQTKAN